jgi:hypothetical protein
MERREQAGAAGCLNREAIVRVPPRLGACIREVPLRAASAFAAAPGLAEAEAAPAFVPALRQY